MSGAKSSVEVTPIVDGEVGAAAKGGVVHSHQEKREGEGGGGGGGGRSRAKG